MDVSVIIPAYNCEKTINKLIESLNTQVTNLLYEVIVVNNASTDRTIEILNSVKDKYTVPLHITNQPRGVTISAVRNYGVSSANGHTLAFIDSDCVPPKGWIQQGVCLLNSNNGRALLAGGYQPPPNGTWVERAWHSTRAGHKQGTFFVHGGNFFISKLLFLEVGGFCENIETSEDYDLGRRIAQKYVVISAPYFTVVHYGEANTLFKKIEKERWYSKNMLDTFDKNHFYKPFWITSLFIIFMLLCIMSLLTAKYIHLCISVLGILMLSSLLSCYFCIKSGNYTYLIPLIPISLAYLMGRSLGVMDALKCKIYGAKKTY